MRKPMRLEAQCLLSKLVGLTPALPIAPTRQHIRLASSLIPSIPPSIHTLTSKWRCMDEMKDLVFLFV